MAESFSRWESDPLFSAAEVVQDSADRMESVYRMLLHEEKLFQGCPSDAKLHTSMQYRRRDLVTALETTKWQLEDFERAVSSAVSSDKSNSRENTISKFRLFVRALREQITQIEETLKGSSGDDFSKSTESMISSGHDTDGLALFLSGDDFQGHHANYASRSSIMKRFLDSATDSNEIIELKTEEMETLPINGLHYSDSKDCDEVGTSSRAYDLEYGGSSANWCPNKNSSRESFWRFLRNFWLPNKNGTSFTKMRKDGELADDFMVAAERKMPHSVFSISPPTKDNSLLIGWFQGTKYERFLSSLQLHGFLDTIQRRLQPVIVFKHFRIRVASAMLITLVILGFVAFHIA